MNLFRYGFRSRIQRIGNDGEYKTVRDRDAVYYQISARRWVATELLCAD